MATGYEGGFTTGPNYLPADPEKLAQAALFTARLIEKLGTIGEELVASFLSSPEGAKWLPHVIDWARPVRGHLSIQPEGYNRWLTFMVAKTGDEQITKFNEIIRQTVLDDPSSARTAGVLVSPISYGRTSAGFNARVDELYSAVEDIKAASSVETDASSKEA